MSRYIYTVHHVIPVLGFFLPPEQHPHYVLRLELLVQLIKKCDPNILVLDLGQACSMEPYIENTKTTHKRLTDISYKRQYAIILPINQNQKWWRLRKDTEIEIWCFNINSSLQTHDSSKSITSFVTLYPSTNLLNHPPPPQKKTRKWGGKRWWRSYQTNSSIIVLFYVCVFIN